jgi:broad specificity phosphatase PhoE
MSTFYLIRHAQHDLLGHVIVGRRPGVHLNAAGLEAAKRLADYLAQKPIHHIFSSPLERARETAEPLSRKLGLELQITPPLLEVDMGDWTGKSTQELDALEDWRKWNTFRSAGRIPHGETMIEIQSRMVGLIERLRREFPQDDIALFSHGDPIRAAVVYYLGLAMDLLQRLEISTASVTALKIDDWGAKLECLNVRPAR